MKSAQRRIDAIAKSLNSSRESTGTARGIIIEILVPTCLVIIGDVSLEISKPQSQELVPFVLMSFYQGDQVPFLVLCKIPVHIGYRMYWLL